MSGAGAGAGAGAGGVDRGLYGDPAADFISFDHVDVDSFFQRSPCAGEGGSDGLTACYSSINDYLQGFLGPAGMARHSDASGPLRDDAVKQEIVVQASGHVDGQGGGAAGGGAPVTPNSSSSDAGEEEPRRRCKKGRPEEKEEEVGDDEGSAAERNCKNKEKKKRGEKKAREPRVAFRTKSEVDHLEDGYRWRKYGQKAVKNSSYPRSYYRCTAARCGVKKQVERSQQDPSSVITTYEGQHTHPSPASVIIRAAGGRSPLQLDLAGRAMTSQIDYARRSSLPAAGLRPPMHLLLQEHRASPQLATHGGVRDFVPAFRDGQWH
ncbi:WRKY transcription factor 23-like [Phragmites australis]|uniref:WRKY transcription factor 23-like n=1 Tax=Phragmites australis TaxID=29695 RepID=UPI002D7A13B3|nr:WRKY transcription factor 23-like [Phragmites australis]